MLDVPSQYDPKFSEEERQQIDEVLVTLRPTESDEKNTTDVQDFKTNGIPLHFPIMTDKELDDLASKKVTQVTKWQTTWAVNVFHGNYILF